MAGYTARNWSSGDIVTAANLRSVERGVSTVAEEYTPTAWANGDTVTATALNNIEQGIANAGGSSWQTVFDGSVTTEQFAPLLYVGEIPNYNGSSTDTIKITFNNIKYTCNKNGDNTYGAFDGPDGYNWDDYPFAIEGNSLITQTAGTHALKVEEPQSGGDSDLSIATMTIVNPNDYSPFIYAPTYIDIPEEDVYRSMGVFVPDMGTSTGKIILYKELCIIYFDKRGEAMSFSVSGNIEDDGDGYYLVSGDCSITIEEETIIE